MDKKGYHQIISGEPREKPRKYLIHEICCDCGLAHAVFYDIKIVDGMRVVTKTVYRDDHETAVARKKKK